MGTTRPLRALGDRRLCRWALRSQPEQPPRLSLGSLLPRKEKSASKREKVRRRRPLSHHWYWDTPARQALKRAVTRTSEGQTSQLEGGGLGSSFKFHKARPPSLPPHRKCILVFPFAGRLLRDPPNRRHGRLSGARVRQGKGDLPFPAALAVLWGQPRLAQVGWPP